MDIDSIALRAITDWRSEEYGCEAQKTAVLQLNINTALKFVLRKQKNSISNELINRLESEAEFMRAIQFDLRVPRNIREALKGRAEEIDKLTMEYN